MSRALHSPSTGRVLYSPTTGRVLYNYQSIADLYSLSGFTKDSGSQVNVGTWDAINTKTRNAFDSNTTWGTSTVRALAGYSQRFVLPSGIERTGRIGAMAIVAAVPAFLQGKTCTQVGNITTTPSGVMPSEGGTLAVTSSSASTPQLNTIAGITALESGHWTTNFSGTVSVVDCSLVLGAYLHVYAFLIDFNVPTVSATLYCTAAGANGSLGAPCIRLSYTS